MLSELPPDRGHLPSETLLESSFVAWEAPCTHCGDRGLVKMTREPSPPFALRPHYCFCLLCGQHYHTIINDLKAFTDRNYQEKEG